MRVNIKIKKSVTLNEKIITIPLNFLLFTDFKEAQYPWWEFEYALHLRIKRWAFCKFHSRGNEVLDHSNCSSYSILFWNNLIIFFLFDIWKVSNYVNDVVLVKLKHVSYLFLVFTVAFEQLDACWNWTISVVSDLEDVYFRKVSIFERVSKKWL